MANTIAQKLRIKEDYTLLTLHAPENFERHLQPLPAGVKIADKVGKADQVHWFVTNKIQLERELGKVMRFLKDDIICWIYYPKGTSNMQTDLTRDKGWDALLDHDELQWLSLIAFDQNWSTFGFRIKKASDQKNENKPKQRDIFNYIDTQKKEVRLPDDMAAAFAENKSAANFYNTLSFTNKKEYVEWIITAKREDTRNQRIEGTIERLVKGWKNPRNV